MSKFKRQIRVPLTERLHQHLKDEADEWGMDMATMVRMALVDWLHFRTEDPPTAYDALVDFSPNPDLH